MFLYVCGQSGDKVDPWKAMIAKFQLTGTNIFLNESQYQEFARQYEPVGFPTYFIFDKQGQLVKKGFEWRPSNDQTLEKIRTLLE